MKDINRLIGDLEEKKHNDFCARKTIFPGKTNEEVEQILDLRFYKELSRLLSIENNKLKEEIEMLNRKA